MKTDTLKPEISLRPFVHSILIMESDRPCELPFYADGFPGIIFIQTRQTAYLLPRKKELDSFFLYGQTIKPIKLALGGPFKLITFQLFPFATKILLGVNPRELNDDCFDLHHVNRKETQAAIRNLENTKNTKNQVKVITDYIGKIVAATVKQTDARLQLAISLILESKGMITVNKLTKQLNTTERTLQRQFSDYIGLSPKQFAKIIQFQFSLTEVSQDSFTKLTEIVYQHGYADQPHFIRDFRKYAGQSPKSIRKKK